jgi:Tfp pilus assembly protein PilN
MIEINLLPGAKRKRGGKGGGLRLPDVTALLAAVKDPWLVAAIAMWTLVLAGAGLVYRPRANHVKALRPVLERARSDSVTYANILIRKRHLEQQRDSLLAEIQVIRDIDRDRYIWPHVLEAVTKSLPPFTWLDDLVSRPGESDSSGGASFQIQGKTAADAQAVTRFMRNLEETSFVQGVTLVSSAMVNEQGRDVTSFVINAHYQVPPMSILTMVPLAASVVQGVRSGGGARR